ncbi:uncharacterized protein BX663DRAFT_556228 [Cokeromyces recurvatus]|uniref:uncharacterized protein n=1 Tax=Cokeromyces recurvatus TaxID=90255 RepID=UPI002220AA1A|nr:uncharacterized protein BX663DRAFT_556228 [Cokeromyces recurvatus]KAI7898035.1 hypothetical protein BX663DRAFT_556228 [Cokeromyces recurvatus]
MWRLLCKNVSLQKSSTICLSRTKQLVNVTKPLSLIQSRNVTNSRYYHYRNRLLLFSRLKCTQPATSLLLNPSRSFSFWKLPFVLVTTLPIKRRLGLITLGGLGLVTVFVFGPFLLVGVGGLAAYAAFRFWRFNRHIRQQLPQQQNWTDLFTTMIQPSSFLNLNNSITLGQHQQAQLESEVIHYFNNWVQFNVGQIELAKHGIYLDQLTSSDVSLRSSSYSTVNTLNKSISKMNIELELDDAPGNILIATAELDKAKNLEIKDIHLITASGYNLHIPLSNDSRKTKRRIIEGEFHDV